MNTNLAGCTPVPWRTSTFRSLVMLISVLWPCSTSLVDGQDPPNGQSNRATNRLTHIDDYCNPYYPSLETARLTTPQWIGEPGVEAVVTLGIDDMRDPAGYEAYLRPILDRLTKLDRRAAVSIMTCSIDPQHPQLQAWIKEGVSIECHTIDHPCPCLQGGNFDRAKSTYDRCVDLMNDIPNNRPVAFRFPCMDSLNTPSPRAFAEIINQTTAKGNYLQISTSVTCLFTPADPKIRKHFFSGQKFEANRFRKYVPFPSFVNQIRNYPYPYLIGNQCWEFPCTIPDDWQGQNLNRPHNPQTVEDLKAAIDATVAKKGVANIIFHPHGWIRAEQLVEVIDHVERQYGKRVKFLTFRECLDRINRNLLKGNPVRNAETGKNDGVRIIDLNGDGFQDVLIGTEQTKLVRIWNPGTNAWEEYTHALQANDTRFGIHQRQVVALNQTAPGKFQWYRFGSKAKLVKPFGQPMQLDRETKIEHVRLRDLDHDGQLDVVVAAPKEKTILTVSGGETEIRVNHRGSFPAAIADSTGVDNGLRFVDLNGDSYDDVILSNDQQSGVFLFDADEFLFRPIQSETEIPRIVSAGKNNGVWFAQNHLWVQNEHTHRLPDGVDRRSFQKILAQTDPKPKAPDAGLKSLQAADEYRVELMAAEPLTMDPVALEWGLDGKLWVVEMADYPLGMDDRGKPGGRVRFLEDTDRDGRYDKSTLFVDGIPFPTGVLPTNIDPDQPSCLITAAPYMVQANQKTSWKDLVADPKNILLSGFGEGNQQHRFNGFSPGLDNWIYLANGDSGGVIKDHLGQTLDIRGRDLRIKLTEPIQVELQTGQTQYGRHRDSWGNWFGCSNPIPVRHYVLPDHYLKRNPHYRYPSPRMDIATSGNTQVFPRSRVLSHWSGYRPPAPGQAHRFTSACSTDFYRGTLFGDEFENNSLTCEPVHNLVHRRIVKPAGVRFSTSRAPSEAQSEFLSSTDSWFRPTTVKTGPDGAIWVTDMYRLVIEHPEWIDDQEEKRLHLRAGHDRGRIYRIAPVQSKPRPLPTQQITEPLNQDDKYTVELTNYLLEMLTTENRWHQETAQRFLVGIGKRNADRHLMPKLIALTAHQRPLVRLHALAVLEGRDEISIQQITRALRDKHPGIRRHAIRISEKFLSSPNDELVEQLQSLVNDPDLTVRMQLAFSLGYLKSPRAAAMLASIGSSDVGPDDQPFLQAAIFSSLHSSNVEGVIREAQSQNANSKFVMTLLQQAAKFGKADLAQAAMENILKRKTSEAEVATAELELVIRICESMAPQLQVTDRNFQLAGRDFTSRFSRAFLPSDSSRRKKARLQLVSRTPFFDLSEKIGFLTQLIEPRHDIELQQMSVAELAKIDKAEIGDFFVSNWRKISPTIRSDFFAAILQRPRWASAFLDAADQGKIGLSEISARQKSQLRGHPDKSIAQRAQSIFSTSKATAQSGTVKKFLSQIENLQRQPDLSRGKILFVKHCAQCHQLGDVGKAVGPNLVTMKDPSRNALVQAVIQPNLAVEDKYRSYVIALKDGRILSGLIQSESSTQIELANQEGKNVKLLRSDIENIKSTGKSLMPEGLDQELEPETLADLVGFIQQSIAQSTTPAERKSFPGNQPKIVVANSRGNVLLAATQCEIFGPSIVFESRYQNLGFWGHPDDQARWKFRLEKSGEYELFLHYACPQDTAGNQLEIDFGATSVKRKIVHTKSWDNYSRISLGRIELQAGLNVATMKAARPLKGFLLDLKSLDLMPTRKEANAQD